MTTITTCPVTPMASERLNHGRTLRSCGAQDPLVTIKYDTHFDERTLAGKHRSSIID